MTRGHYTFLLTLLICVSGFSQNPERLKELADRYFDSYSYNRAVELYEEIPEKDVSVFRNMGMSYLKLNEIQKAEEYLNKVVMSDQNSPEDIFNYSQVLAMNKKYPESVKWMTVYHEEKSDDSRAERRIEEPEYYVEIEAEEAMFEVKNLDINTAEEDFGATFYKDKVVFASSRTGVETVVRRWNWNQLAFLDMYVADMDSTYSLFEPKRHHKKFNKKFHEGPASFNKAGDIMVYTSNNYKKRSSKGEVNLELYETKYDAEKDKWNKPEPLPWNNKEYSVGHASLTADGNTMFFVSDMPGGYGGADLYKATRNSDGTWGEAQLLDVTVNTEGNEMFPFIQKDSILFFASDGHLGAGGLDIFYLDFRSDGVKRAKNIKLPVNSSMDDFAFVMNDERTKGYFSSNRDGGKGDDDIYSFELPSPMKFNKMLKGRVTDQLETSIADAKIILVKNGKVVDEYVTKEDGVYEFEVSPEEEYQLMGSKTDYTAGANSVDLLKEKADVVYSDLMLTRTVENVKSQIEGLDIYADNVIVDDGGLMQFDFDPDVNGMSILTLVSDATSGELIEGAKVTIVDKKNGGKKEFSTNQSGGVTEVFDPKKNWPAADYLVTIEKEGYRTISYAYKPKMNPKGQYRNIASLIPENMPSNTIMRDVFDINPIYFDLDKYDIRPDAAEELNRIVDIMNKMPNMEIELTSHTDCRSSRKYNKRLSNNRAVATADYIKSKISNPSRIYGEGRGEMQLVNDCECEEINWSSCPEDEHQQNRRTEFRIVKF